MGKAAIFRLNEVEKETIREAWAWLGGRRQFVMTHNHDGKEEPIEVAYRAYAVMASGGFVSNRSRLLPGCIRIDELLREVNERLGIGYLTI